MPPPPPVAAAPDLRPFDGEAPTPARSGLDVPLYTCPPRSVNGHGAAAGGGHDALADELPSSEDDLPGRSRERARAGRGRGPGRPIAAACVPGYPNPVAPHPGRPP